MIFFFINIPFISVRDSEIFVKFKALKSNLIIVFEGFRNSSFHSASGLIKVSSDVSKAYTELFSHNVRENSSDKGLHSERNCL